MRIDSNDYSVDPSVIGRLVDVHADLCKVRICRNGRLVAAHDRVWARGMTITDAAHVATAKILRQQYQQPRPASEPPGQESLVRDLAEYDHAFGLTEDLTAVTGGEVA